MTKNRLQIRVEDFLKELSLLSQKYGLLLDANGNLSEGTPLSLYARAGKAPNYKKIGCLYYSFEGDEEKSVYNFDPKQNSHLETIQMSLKDLENSINLSEDLISFDDNSNIR